MMKTAKISDINPSDRESWEGKWFITLDIDWAVDEFVHEAIDLLEELDISATWFATHSSKALHRIRANDKFELGIHPNFNPLLTGEAAVGSGATDVLNNIMEVVPEAKSVRSHSLTYSSRLVELFIGQGLTHEVNYMIPWKAGISMAPWTYETGIIRVPYAFDDYLNLFQFSTPDWRIFSGLKVVNFHPIHLSLNSETLDRYEGTRQVHRNPTALRKQLNRGYGTRDVLMNLVQGLG